MVQPIKGKPMEGTRQKLGDYQLGDSSHALCEQLRTMQSDMSKTKRSIDEVLDMIRQMLGSMQEQLRQQDSLMRKADKASGDADRAVKIIADAADSMRTNTDMIVRASLITAFAIADEDKFNVAAERAEQEMNRWKAEQTGLKIVSGNE